MGTVPGIYCQWRRNICFFFEILIFSHQTHNSTLLLFIYSLLSPFCSPLTSSSERPIRLRRGFTGWGCEGKPKWNAAHLLEWNQDEFSSIIPYALLTLLLPPTALIIKKRSQSTLATLVWICMCSTTSNMYQHSCTWASAWGTLQIKFLSTAYTTRADNPKKKRLRIRECIV